MKFFQIEYILFYFNHFYCIYNIGILILNVKVYVKLSADFTAPVLKSVLLSISFTYTISFIKIGGAQ